MGLRQSSAMGAPVLRWDHAWNWTNSTDTKQQDQEQIRKTKRHVIQNNKIKNKHGKWKGMSHHETLGPRLLACE
jgi:hypothetical protein